MTVKKLIEILKACDEESIVYIDYSNNCGEVIIITTTVK